MFRSLLPLLLLLTPVARAADAEAAFSAESPTTATEVSATEVSGDGEAEASEATPPADKEDRWFQAVGRSRYLLGHSGMMLRSGEGVVSQKELLYTMASVGLTDHVTVTLGSVLPGVLQGRRGINVVGGVKVGGSLSERLHLAAGVEMAVLPFMSSGFGLAYGSLTYGTPDAHVTVGGGVTPIFYTNQFVPSGSVVGNISGHLRMTRRLAVVTEHWAFFSQTPLADPMINSLALRVLGEHWSVDLGAVRLPGSFFVPWVDLSWHWGT